MLNVHGNGMAAGHYIILKCIKDDEGRERLRVRGEVLIQTIPLPHMNK